MKLCTMIFLLTFVLITYAEKADSSINSSLYTVKAEIKEVKHRTLEAVVRGHKVIIDQPTMFGADDLGPTPPEYLAISYGSCIISTIQFIAMQRGLKIENVSVAVEGVIDFSKAMGIQSSKRAGLSGLKTKIYFKSSLNDEEKKAFLSDVFKVGAAIDNIQNTTPVTYEIIDIK
ncbi:MAG TPA: OsmC family protein [Chitinispirillaceae bacterium]|nr:OsmC family protein [Chitinispirillaceae bacterium]